MKVAFALTMTNLKTCRICPAIGVKYAQSPLVISQAVYTSTFFCPFTSQLQCQLQAEVLNH